MKSSKLFWLVLIFIPTLIFGQENGPPLPTIGLPAYNPSKKNKLPRKEKVISLEEVIPVPNNGFILFKTDDVAAPTILDFSYYNIEGELVSNTKIPTTRTNELFAIERLFIWNNQLIICSALYQPGYKQNHLLYYAYSLPDLKLVKSEILLKTIAPPNVLVPYFVSISPDSSKLAILGWNYKNPEGKASVKTKIFDKNLNEIRTDNYSFDYENQRIAIDEIFIDNNNKIYITGNNYKGDLEFISYKNRLDYFVVELLPNSQQKFYSIKKEKYHFNQIVYKINKEQTLVGTGFWSQGTKTGIGFISITPDTQNMVTEAIELIDFKEAYHKNLPTIKPPNHKFLDYDLNHFISKEDGYVVIGENRFKADHLNDILAIKLSKTGQVEWLSRIPKSQNIFRMKENLASFSLIERKDKLYFIFNDNYQNYESGNKKYKSIRSAIEAKPTIAKLSLGTGIAERTKLESLIQKDYFFVPSFCQSISNQKVVVVAAGDFSKAGKILLKKIQLKE